MRQLHPQKHKSDSNERDNGGNNEKCSHSPSIPPTQAAENLAGFQTETLPPSRTGASAANGARGLLRSPK